jgi:hypothetical protein
MPRFKTSRPESTLLSLPLLVALIAPPIFTAAGQSDDVPTAPARTGFDASATVAQAAVPTPLPSTRYQPSRRHIAKGAGRGAALGAVGGAIAGDAGKGAAAGAAMGGLAGGMRRRDERRQQQGTLQR